MTDSAELSYFEQRVSQEQAAALRADDVAVRSIHLDLARLFDERLRRLLGDGARAAD